MKATHKFQIVWFAIIALGLTAALAQEPEPNKEIESVLRGYFEAMAARDTEGLKSLLDKHFVFVQAGQEKARTRLVNTGDPNGLFPPGANNEWQKLKISAVRIERNPTTPSVAMAYVTLKGALDEAKLDMIRSVVNLPQLTESQRKQATQALADRAITVTAFSLLARLDTNWKLVCLTFPD